MLTQNFPSSAEAADPLHPPELCLRAISSRPGPELLPELLEAIDRASGWVLDRQMLSVSMLHVQLEAQGRALLDLYASLIEVGLELSRSSHRMLTERCACARLSNNLCRGIVSMSLHVALTADPSPLRQWCSSRTA